MTDNILIIDHNIIRFHHVDLMESFLHHFPIFNKLRPEYHMYLKMKPEEKIHFFTSVNKKKNIMDFFSDKDKHTPSEYVYMMNNMLEYSGKYTATEGFGKNIELLTNVNIASMYILKFTGDRFIPSFGSNSEIIYRDNILDPDTILPIIQKYDISTIILDDSDLMIDLAKKTKYKRFMIKPYAYNLTKIGNLTYYKYADIITELTKNNVHQFISLN